MCMTDAIPQIEFGLGDNLERIVILDESDSVDSIPALVSAVPGLMSPDCALQLAEAINHLAVGDGFDLISDPAAYQADYEARLAAEDPNQPWQEGVIRLSDFGRPDYSEIKAPFWNGTAVVFFAKDDFTGLPYRVEAVLAPKAQSLSEDDYKAVGLTAIATEPTPSAPKALSEEDKAFLEMMSGGVETPNE